MPVFEPQVLNDQQRLDWLRLIRTPNIGPLTFYRIMERFNGDAAVALEALPELAAKAGRKKYSIFPLSRAENELERLNNYGGRMIMACESEYPQSLKMIEDAPPVISVIGKIELLNTPNIAIVGARNASINGKNLAKKMAMEFGEAGYTVISGLARGIDTAVHEGALDTGTIAVLAGGVDNIYPPQNKELYQSIGENGIIVSENAFGMVPKAQHFPRRNRIVSGISVATIVVEATTKSGSLITARLAFEQGREVFAVPGNPSDPRAGGPNQLIKRQQAQLITSAHDVIQIIKDMVPQQIEPVKRPNLWEEPLDFIFEDEHETPEKVEKEDIDLPIVQPVSLTDYLSTTPIEIDDLVHESGQSIDTILTFLLELEIEGRIQRHAGNKVSLIKTA